MQAVRKAFTETWSKRGGITIGPEAEELAKQGWRLVHDVHAPRSYDLKLPRAAAKPAKRRRPLGFAESCTLLKKLGLLVGRAPKAPPACTPDPLGDTARISLFRSLAQDADLSGVTLPRTLICRSELSGVRLTDADLRGSFLCWNDLVEVDLTGANLEGVDARASEFVDCRFDRATLDGADLRRSTFRGCTFTGATFRSARLTRRQATSMGLTAAQRRQAALTTDKGPEPPGG